MNRYRFRLAAVLRFRERIEDLRAAAVALVDRERVAATATLDSLQRDAEGRRHALVSTAERGTSGTTIRGLAEDIEQVNRCATRASAQLADVSARLESLRAALMVAARDRRMLERLDEIQRAVWARESARREQREIDDLAGAYDQRRRAATEPAQ